MPRKMTTHFLNPKKGVAIDVESLDFTAPLSADVTIDPLYNGRVVHVNEDFEFATGAPDSAIKIHMPIFLFQDSDSPDVVNDGGITGDDGDDPNGYIGIWPTGQMKGFVATGGYELETTEFEPEAGAGVYLPGDPLRAINADTNATTGGRITKGTPYTHTIVGTVSRGVVVNEYGVSTLAFWPLVLPKTP